MVSPGHSFLPEFLSQGNALCAEADPDAWFPEQGEPNDAAKAVCRRCDLRDPCLTFAVLHDVDGVWGATSQWERRKLKGRIAPGAVEPRSRLYRVDAAGRRRIVELSRIGWTPTEIARELSISPRTVQRIKEQARGEAA